MDKYKDYSVSFAFAEDLESSFNVLAPYLSKDSNIKFDSSDATSRRIQTILYSAIVKSNVYLLRYIDEVVGVYVIQVDNKVPYIAHGAIISKHRNTTGSLLLMNYVVNVVYKGVQLFCQGSPEGTRSLFSTHHSGLNRGRADAPERISKVLAKRTKEA